MLNYENAERYPREQEPKPSDIVVPGSIFYRWNERPDMFRFIDHKDELLLEAKASTGTELIIPGDSCEFSATILDDGIRVAPEFTGDSIFFTARQNRVLEIALISSLEGFEANDLEAFTLPKNNIHTLMDAITK